MQQRKLTIGTLTCDDHHGLYFTIQSLRLHHPEVADDVEFIVLDNNPESKHGKANQRFVKWIPNCQYVPVTDVKGTALRSRIFELAKTPYVLVVDSHVMFQLGAIRKIIDFFDAGKDCGGLLQGPLLYDNLRNFATHFDETWRCEMLGVWGTDPRGADTDGEPFEIRAQGLGVFACRKNSWLGFSPYFKGFGGEECYIHEKFRQAGKRTLCLPFLRWIHRFERPDGVPYPLRIEDKVKNYIIGHRELGLPVAPIKEHFNARFTEAQWATMLE